MKSYACGESLLRIFLITKIAFVTWGCCFVVLPPWTACRMQHEVVKVVIPLIVSSEITSSPPVAPIISSIPRSKRSYFFISKE